MSSTWTGGYVGVQRAWIGRVLALCIGGTSVLVGCRGESGTPDEGVGATATAPAAADIAAEKPLGPHGGQLLPIPERRGLVEWVTDETGRRVRVYFLAPDDRPLVSVSEPVLVLGTSAGPKSLKLADCEDPQFPNACWQVSAEDWPSSPTEMLIRFVIGGEGFRVRLPAADGAR